jgi:hypothetical protein
MTESRCPKCGNTNFELGRPRINGSAFKLNSIQCAGCGAVVGVVEADNVNARLREMEKALTLIAIQVGAVVTFSNDR